MADVTNKGDLRIIKTENALVIAMLELLKRQGFGKIRVRDICDEAQISRATFYAHYTDKYDLLKCLLIRLKQNYIGEEITYEQLEIILNDFIREHEPAMKNLLSDADKETLNILFAFIIAALNLHDSSRDGADADPKQVIISHFCAGGVISYFLWQIDNKFPPNVLPLNQYLYEAIHFFQKWK